VKGFWHSFGTVGTEVESLGSHTRSCAEHAQESLLCGDVSLWPLSVSAPDQPRGRDSRTNPGGGHVGLAGVITLEVL